MDSNPFEVTKAVDLTDEEIASTWVDLPGGGFGSLANPRSPMPKFIVGGKGGGRTHLLRYFSFALQRIRHGASLLEGIKEDGYIGIYSRCHGLNSYRFADKGQPPEIWSAIFAYYTEVWLGRLTIDLIGETRRIAGEIAGSSSLRFANAVRDLFDFDLPNSGGGDDPISELSQTFRTIQKDLDEAVNNVALSRSLQVTIGASPGRLAFGVPRLVVDHFGELKGVKFAYLLDEFENLTAEQQKYVNTLVREKELPCTFVIGSRLFGMRTQETLSAGEENREGSEYDLIVLEDTYRSDKASYKKFCSDIVRLRLSESGFDPSVRGVLEESFEDPQRSIGSLEERARAHLCRNSVQGGLSPWFARLSTQLANAVPTKELPAILHLLTSSEDPLLEKFAVFLLYRAWSDGLDLLRAADEIRSDLQRLREEGPGRSKTAVTYKHYRADLYAQLLNDLREPQEYFGLDDFIRMSGFLPRNLLLAMKRSTRWSLFLGEEPFRKVPLSMRAQAEGIREASAWFLNDAKGLGRIGEETQIAIRRLGSLFREMRFSDKPAEVACSAFSTDRQGLSRPAIRSLNEAISHSLLLEVPSGRRDRNSRVFIHKYQLNPMLAPMFDLSLALRGVADLSVREINTVFDPEVSEEAFAAEKAARLARLNAPFSGVVGQTGRLFA